MKTSNPNQMSERQLDMAVELEVMGMCPCGDPTMVAPGAGLKGGPPRKFSTDHNAMAELLAKIDRQLEIFIHRCGDGGEKDQSGLYRIVIEGLSIETYSPSLPRAVAETALLAARAKKETTNYQSKALI